MTETPEDSESQKLIETNSGYSRAAKAESDRLRQTQSLRLCFWETPAVSGPQMPYETDSSRLRAADFKWVSFLLVFLFSYILFFLSIIFSRYRFYIFINIYSLRFIYLLKLIYLYLSCNQDKPYLIFIY